MARLQPEGPGILQEGKKAQAEKYKVVAFGSTHRPKHKASEDSIFRALLDSKVNIITIFGKTWDFHVKEALRISLNENLDLINSSVAYLKKHVETVFFDAEHFFDGYKDNPKYALKCLLAAQEAGADCIIPCDTNGGTLPGDVQRIFREVMKDVRTPLGIHAHNDSECGGCKFSYRGRKRRSAGPGNHQRARRTVR